MLRLSIAATTLAFCTPGFAQDVATMETYVAAQEESGTFMGSVLVAKGDEILLDNGYGEANVSWSIPNSSATKFRIGSVTKQFTAVAILMLEEQGKLSLDAPIANYLEGTPSAWAPVTVRHLLTHTSGIPSITSFDDFGTIKMLPATRETLIAEFRDEPLEFTPGTKFEYSNSGYLLLTAVVEDVSEQPYGDFLNANIFAPLRMSDTGIDDNTSVIAKRASGYSPSADGIVRAEYVNMDIPQGGGGLYSTTHDLLKWQRGLFGGHLISQEALTEYVTPARDNYALGVFVRKNEAGTVYLHSGGIEGFNSWLGYDPDRKITVAVLANLNGPKAAEIGTGLMGLAQGGQLKSPIQREAVAIDPDQFAEYEGVYAVAPTFKITVFREGNGLKAQATGQDAFDIFPESEDRFFLKVVDAQLLFNRDESGAITGLILFQNGREMPGAKE